MKSYHLPIVVEHDHDGYFAACPSLQGCYSQGETYEETLVNIHDAIKLHLEDRLADDEPIYPEDSTISLAMVDVAV
jgi:predicted RNase H-like HicB family nuclease